MADIVASIHRYHTPGSLEEALKLLQHYGQRARIMAGGTDLILELDRGTRSGVEVLVDVTRLSGLNEISDGADNVIHLGPLVTHNQVVASDLIVKHALPLAQAAWEVGSPQIRNRGTVAGNLITASPANDTISPLWALDATVTLAANGRRREVPLRQFYRGVRETVMQPEEMLIDIGIPLLPSTSRGLFVKLGLRRAQAISVVHATVILDLDGDVVKEARLALGSVAPTVISATQAENYLNGRRLSDAVISQASQLAASDARPIDDIRGGASYRRRMVEIMVRRGLLALRDGQERVNWPQKPVMLWGEKDERYPTGENYASTLNPESSIVSTVNGKILSAEVGDHPNLLRWLRAQKNLTGTKEGCNEGECGACTVYLDDIAVMSCLVPAQRAHGANIITIEGLSDYDQNINLRRNAPDDQTYRLQQAFVDAGAVQCGYCIPGFVMAGAKLLEEQPNPGPPEIAQALTGNLCRCTGYYKILEAIALGRSQENER